MSKGDTSGVYGIVRCTWVTRSKDKHSLMLVALVETNGNLGTVGTFCGGGPTDKPPFVPRWCEEVGFEGELKDLNRSRRLDGVCVRIARKGEYWNVYSAWGQFAVPDSAFD